VAVKAQQEQKQEQEQKQVKGNLLSVPTLFLNDQARLPRRVVRSDRPSDTRKTEHGDDTGSIRIFNAHWLLG
jgi:hypothetical protein